MLFEKNFFNKQQQHSKLLIRSFCLNALGISLMLLDSSSISDWLIFLFKNIKANKDFHFRNIKKEQREMNEFTKFIIIWLVTKPSLVMTASCTGTVCYNGGTCNQQGSTATCICAAGYTGSNCLSFI